MATRRLRALVQARSVNSLRLAILLCLVGVLGLVRIVAYPVPDIAFLVFAFWLLGGLLYDIGMRPLARFVPAQVMQWFMFAFDITVLTVFRVIVGGGWWMAATIYVVVVSAAIIRQTERIGYRRRSVVEQKIV
jgi:hypothetical protein